MAGKIKKKIIRKDRRLPKWVFPAVVFGVIFFLLEEAADVFKDAPCGFGMCTWIAFSFGA